MATNRRPSPTPSAAKRIAQRNAEAARQRLAAAQRRRRLTMVGVPLAVVVLVIGVFVVVKLVTGAGGPKSGKHASGAPTAVTAQLAAVPAGVFDQVGTGTTSATPKRLSSPALIQDGLPLLVYIGAEYCPYCAAERWAVAVALDRFGTWTGLGQTSSSPSDVFPSTPTLTFHGATYSSRYLAVTAKEIQSNQVVDGQYAKLDSLTAAEEALINSYDKPPYASNAGGIPFIDIGGRYVVSGATYDPGVLQGKTQAAVAAALTDPSAATTRGIIGSANLITASICAITNQQPAAVCSGAGVRAAATSLAGSA